MENLGDTIRDERRKRKLTLERLSEKTNLSKSFLSQVERGLAQPSISSLKKIAQEFAISVVDLFSLELKEKARLDPPVAVGKNGQPYPEQIIEDAVKSYEAGAALAHIHVRDPKNGKPTADPNIFRQVLSAIKKRCNLILLPTTGGGINQTIQEKLIPIKQLKPEMCSFDPAPFNLGIFQVAGRYEKFKYDWELEYMNFWKTTTFAPTFDLDLQFAKTFMEIDTKPEFEIYEIGHVCYIKWLMDEGLVKLPPHMQFVMGGMVGWMLPSVKHLVQLYQEALDVLGEGKFTWSVAGGGRWQIPLAAAAMAMGAPNVRVGLEDSLYAGKGKMAKSSADQVRMAVNIAKELGLEPATPDEAREILGLKGIDKVGF